MKKCLHCEERREVALALHHGGGNYRRAGQYRKANICLECATLLVGRVTPGHNMVARWDLISLKSVIRKLSLKDEQ